jgi:hypothetical protein
MLHKVRFIRLPASFPLFSTFSTFEKSGAKFGGNSTFEKSGAKMVKKYFLNDLKNIFINFLKLENDLVEFDA